MGGGLRNKEPLRIRPTEGALVQFRIEFDGCESQAGNRFTGVHAGGLGERVGINAIEKALTVITGLQELERQWGNLRRHSLPPARQWPRPPLIGMVFDSYRA
jgi:hypothetical protein